MQRMGIRRWNWLLLDFCYKVEVKPDGYPATANVEIKQSCPIILALWGNAYPNSYLCVCTKLDMVWTAVWEQY